MRILRVIASSDLASGGPIEGVLRVGEMLAARGHRQDLLTIDPPDAAWLPIPGVTVHALGRHAGGGPLGRLLARARYAPAALGWLRAHVDEYDAVIVSGLWNYATHLARRVLPGAGVPYVVFTHGMLDPWFARTYPAKTAFKRALWRVNEGVLLNRAAAVVFTTDEERRLARDGFRPYRVRERVVSYGTADAPPEDEAQTAAFAAMVPALGARRYLLFLSRIHEKKGCDLLVEAFARIAADHPELDLVIAGPDQVGLRATLEAQAAKAGIGARLHWPGMLRGAAKWGAFRGCAAFVLPSHQENFGIVVAEAMACAKPVLISDQVNIWREVRDSGSGIVEPDTADGAERMLRGFLALDDAARAAMGARARATFLERFEIGRAADDLLAVLDEAIGAAKARGRA